MRYLIIGLLAINNISAFAESLKDDFESAYDVASRAADKISLYDKHKGTAETIKKVMQSAGYSYTIDYNSLEENSTDPYIYFFGPQESLCRFARQVRQIMLRKPIGEVKLTCLSTGGDTPTVYYDNYVQFELQDFRFYLLEFFRDDDIVIRLRITLVPAITRPSKPPMQVPQ